MSIATARPNLLFVMSDDHAAHAISAYGSAVNQTPNIDQIAQQGARLDRVFCTNSSCTLSRATILSGTYSHVNGACSIYSELDYRVPPYSQGCRPRGTRPRSSGSGTWASRRRPDLGGSMTGASFLVRGPTWAPSCTVRTARVLSRAMPPTSSPT